MVRLSPSYLALLLKAAALGELRLSWGQISVFFRRQDLNIESVNLPYLFILSTALPLQDPKQQ